MFKCYYKCLSANCVISFVKGVLANEVTACRPMYRTLLRMGQFGVTFGVQNGLECENRL